MKRALTPWSVVFLAFGLAGWLSGCGGGAKPTAAEGGAPKPQTSETKPAEGKALAFANPSAGKCPVTLEPIDETVTTQLGGKTYAFCCEDCVEKFTKEPAKYLPADALPKETKAPAKTEPVVAAPGEGTAVTFGKEASHALRLPAGWKQEAPANPMRLFQASVPKHQDDTEGAELTVSKAMGGVEANLKRWAGQFGGDEALKGKRTVKTGAGSEATVADFEGTYTAMAMGPQKAEPKSDYKMLGAIVGAEDGTYFLKLTGPRHTVDLHKAAFDRLVESFK